MLQKYALKMATVILVGCSFSVSGLADDSNIPTPPTPTDPSVPPVVVPETVKVAVWATDGAALVGTSTAAFTFVRSGATDADLEVPFAYSGSAVLGTDFSEEPVTLNDKTNKIIIPKGYAAVDLLITPKLNPDKRGNKNIYISLNKEALDLAKAGHYHPRAEVRLVDDTFNDLPPTVVMKAPLEGAVFELPADVKLSAMATDTDDTVKKVSFYSGDHFVGSSEAVDADGAFSFLWVNPSIGTHEVFARAIDASGKSAISSSVKFTVNGVLPTITIAEPLNKAQIKLGENVAISGTATGTGKLTVDLYDGSKLLQSSEGAAFSYTLNAPSVGRHVLTAKVTDSVAQKASASVTITVADTAPEVKITEPTQGQSFPRGSVITLKAVATDADGAIQKVTFWANYRPVGEGVLAADKSAYEYKWVGARSGLYKLQAVAVNSNGTVKISDPVSINVSR